MFENEELPMLQPRGETHAQDADSMARTRPFYPGLPTGTGIGKYRILERIRTYHNAVVYKARDQMLDRLVAVKQMSPELMDSPIACGNFRREAQLLARLPKDARHVLNIHELIEDEIGLFIVEEFVPGHWLESLIFKRQVDHRAAYKLLKTSAMGLRTLHSHMIVHRDIHPGNIMVTKGGGVKIANLTSAAHEGDLSPPPVITPQYAAPELLLEKRYDNRVDIYGLGLVIYEVCVGRHMIEQHFRDVFESSFPVGRWIEWQTDYQQHLPDACELNPLVPPQLSAILRRMTAKHLDQRYTSMDEVLEAISGFFTTQASGPEAGRALPSSVDTGWKASRYLPTYPEQTSQGPSAAPIQGPTAESGLRRTSTHTVRSTRRPYTDSSQWQWHGVDSPAPAAGHLPSRRSAHRRARRPLSVSAGIPRPQAVTVIPAPPSVHEVHKKRMPRFVRWTLMFLLIVSLGGAAGSAIWYFRHGPGAINPMEQLINLGIAEYERGNISLAQSHFEEAQRIESNDRDSAAWRERSKFWLELTAAQIALENGHFETVAALLRDASKRGVNPGKVDELQQKAWIKRDAQRLAAEGMEHLAEGNLVAVEARLDEYAQKAAAVGMDPSQLKDSLNLTRKDLKYQEHIKQAREALKRGELLEAITACERAEALQITSETRELRTAITNAQSRKQWVDKGDQAMIDREFAEAERCYIRAIQITPGVELERKARLAKAYVLYMEAEELLKTGDLLEAEKKLKSSLWNTPTPEGQSRYTNMAPAFDAARLVRNADREVEAGRFKEAVNLYQQAIPRLPPPADAAAEKKLLEARRALLILEGDAAMEAGDTAAALRAYDEAQKIRRGKDIDQRLTGKRTGGE